MTARALNEWTDELFEIRARQLHGEAVCAVIKGQLDACAFLH